MANPTGINQYTKGGGAVSRIHPDTLRKLLKSPFKTHKGKLRTGSVIPSPLSGNPRLHLHKK